MDESTVYVVRIWHDPAAFRATARAVENDETAVFSEPVELMHFLAPFAVASSDATTGKQIPKHARKAKVETSKP